MDPKAKSRLRPPLMFAFREAHEAKDAKKKLDLRDEAGERVVAGRRAPPRAVINESKLRREVSRDLDLLINSINLGSSEDLSPFPQVERSILNHGLPDIANRSIDELRVNNIVKEIETAIHDFEPRLIGRTIVVTRDESLDTAELKVRFKVAADLFCEPLNVPVEFIADLELDTGKFVIHRR
jgi:type VI secretion system protein ImpF